ncbi:MAG: phosphatase PAP2 family protein [Lachnospiraceae bacterium]|nr:phosphatase PAP2 family protein [Lachnospiraceae bacterium]
MEKIKKQLYKYKHAWLFSYFLLYLPWFFYLEQRKHVSYISVHMPLDDCIPFCEYFIIPYLLWFAYIATGMLYLFFTDKKGFYRCCAILYAGMTICLLIYTFFPNAQALRPAVLESDSIFAKWVENIYRSDTPTNVCPSIHVFNSIGLFLCLWQNKKCQKHKAVLLSCGVLTVSICLSTMFLKQHSCVDVFYGTLLALILYTLVYKVNYQHAIEGLRNWSIDWEPNKHTENE